MAESPETTEMPPETRGKQPPGATENHVHNFIGNSYLFPCIYTPPAPSRNPAENQVHTFIANFLCGDPVHTENLF